MSTCDWDCGPTSLYCSQPGGSRGSHGNTLSTCIGSVLCGGGTNITCSGGLLGCGGGTSLTCSGSLFGGCGGGTNITCSGGGLLGCGGGHTYLICGPTTFLDCRPKTKKPKITDKDCLISKWYTDEVCAFPGTNGTCGPGLIACPSPSALACPGPSAFVACPLNGLEIPYMDMGSYRFQPAAPPGF